MNRDQMSSKVDILRAYTKIWITEITCKNSDGNDRLKLYGMAIMPHRLKYVSETDATGRATTQCSLNGHDQRNKGLCCPSRYSIG